MRSQVVRRKRILDGQQPHVVQGVQRLQVFRGLGVESARVHLKDQERKTRLDRVQDIQVPPRPDLQPDTPKTRPHLPVDLSYHRLHLPAAGLNLYLCSSDSVTTQ